MYDVIVAVILKRVEDLCSPRSRKNPLRSEISAPLNAAETRESVFLGRLIGVITPKYCTVNGFIRYFK